MAEDDLSKLKIDKSLKTGQPFSHKRFRYIIVVCIVLIITGILYGTGMLTPAVPVEVAVVSQIYPAQTFTLLNASGYVVAQRKAAVASKITGRLDSLMVSEGSRVKKGQIIARLENEDAVAAREQAKAHLGTAHANLEQVRAEYKEATLTFERNKRLIVNGSISRVEYDNSEIRLNRAKASIDAAEAAIKASAAALRAASCCRRIRTYQGAF